MYEFYLYPLKMYTQTNNELCTSKLTTVIVLYTDIHTYRNQNYYHAASRVITS